jgi:glycosyltransferase involved in cell wall biosynthesis
VSRPIALSGTGWADRLRRPDQEQVMSLTVLNVAFPLAEVGPDAVGGAEQVLTWLDAALVAAGHRSVVVAAEGSRVIGELWKIPATAGRPIDDAVRCALQEAQRRTIRQILKTRRVDLVHMHGIDFPAYLPEREIPVLATLHLPLDWYPDEIFHLPRADIYLHCVSRAQQQSCPPGVSLLPVIENGVPLQALSTRLRKRQFAAALGRICPEKGFHVALDAARRAGISLLLAGKLFRHRTHEDYFTREIVPRLDSRRRFIGPVGLAEKRRLLTSARCLIVPSLVAETSSLVSMEALACGTPVIAFARGALADIVQHGKTGFIVHDESEMVEAILAAGDLDPEVCRNTAWERFSLARMSAAYFAVYRQLACRSAAREFARRDSASLVTE